MDAAYFQGRNGVLPTTASPIGLASFLWNDAQEFPASARVLRSYSNFSLLTSHFALLAERSNADAALQTGSLSEDLRHGR